VYGPRLPRLFELRICRGAACCAVSWQGKPFDLAQDRPCPCFFVMRDSEMCIPELSEIASVTSFPRT
jgi:hypothetical protein